MRPIIALVLLIMCAHSAELRAEIYKCKEADGTLTYSQTPCSKEAPVKVQTSGSSDSAIDCSYANKFAVSTAQLMRKGIASDEVFNRYGGLDALSRGSIGVINYVYSYRTNLDVTAERIAGLTQAKCKAKGFGDVSCEVLPLSFTESLGGCDAEEGESLQPAAANGEAAAPFGEQPQATIVSGNQASQQVVAASDKELIEQCKKSYRDQIDAVDAQMRNGYSSQQGEKFRERLRALTEKLRAC